MLQALIGAWSHVTDIDCCWVCRAPLQFEDIWELPPDDRVDQLAKRFRPIWQEQLERRGGPSLVRPLHSLSALLLYPFSPTTLPFQPYYFTLSALLLYPFSPATFPLRPCYFPPSAPATLPTCKLSFLRFLYPFSPATQDPSSPATLPFQALLLYLMSPDTLPFQPCCFTFSALLFPISALPLYACTLLLHPFSPATLAI